MSIKGFNSSGRYKYSEHTGPQGESTRLTNKTSKRAYLFMFVTSDASLFVLRMPYQLLCICADNCLVHARPMALRMRTLLPCSCPIYMNPRHAHAIALHMRKPLPRACAPHCFAHAQAIIPRTSTIRKHASRMGARGVSLEHVENMEMFSLFSNLGAL